LGSSSAQSKSANCATSLESRRRDKLPNLRADVIALKGNRQVGDHEAGLVPAIVPYRIDLERMKWLGADQLRHGVGQLDFAARAFFALVEDGEHVGLKDKAADHTEPRRGLVGRGLLDQPADFGQGAV